MGHHDHNYKRNIHEDIKPTKAALNLMIEDAEDIAEAEAAMKEYRKNGKSISHEEMK